MKPSVAVVIPAHNRSDLLRQTLHNLACQDGVELQIAVVDDASSDDTPSVVAEFARLRSDVYSERFEHPRGACVARNRGLSETDASFVCFLDSDDLLHPEALARQVARLEAHGEADLVVCQMAHFDVDPNERTLLWNTFRGEDPRDRFLRHDPVWGIHGPLWRRAAIERIGGFDESLPMAQDFELHARALLLGCRAVLAPELLAYCRRHTGPSIGTSKTIARLKVLTQVFGTLLGLIDLHVDTDVDAMIGNHLWLATLGALHGEGDVMSANLEKARALDGRLKLTKFEFLCRAYMVAKRHRLFAAARTEALRLGFDLQKREAWHMHHRVDDEPGIVTFPMPESSWRKP